MVAAQAGGVTAHTRILEARVGEVAAHEWVIATLAWGSGNWYSSYE